MGRARPTQCVMRGEDGECVCDERLRVDFYFDKEYFGFKKLEMRLKLRRDDIN